MSTMQARRRTRTQSRIVSVRRREQAAERKVLSLLLDTLIGRLNEIDGDPDLELDPENEVPFKQSGPGDLTDAEDSGDGESRQSCDWHPGDPADAEDGGDNEPDSDREPDCCGGANYV